MSYSNPLGNPYVAHVKSLFQSTDPQVQSELRSANAALVSKALTPGAVHVDQTLTNISLQYKNAEYIGIQLMPVVQVPNLSAIYFTFDRRDKLSYPDDAMTARSSPNELSENVNRAHVQLDAYAYKEYLDNLTIQNQSTPLISMVDVVANLNEGLDFREELRIASILTNPANFGANTTNLVGGDKWGSSTANILTQIQTARAGLWTGRGPTKLVGYTSLAGWNALIQSASIRGAFLGGPQGRVPTKQEVIDLLGLDDILVSEARKDVANEGQAGSYARIWGDVFGIVRVAQQPSIRSAAFGFTFRMGGKETAEWFDPTIGPRGGYYARVSLIEGHAPVAPDTGFLVTGLFLSLSAFKEKTPWQPQAIPRRARASLRRKRTSRCPQTRPRIPTRQPSSKAARPRRPKRPRPPSRRAIRSTAKSRAHTSRARSAQAPARRPRKARLVRRLSSFTRGTLKTPKPLPKSRPRRCSRRRTSSPAGTTRTPRPYPPVTCA